MRALYSEACLRALAYPVAYKKLGPLLKPKQKRAGLSLRGARLAPSSQGLRARKTSTKEGDLWLWGWHTVLAALQNKNRTFKELWILPQKESAFLEAIQGPLSLQPRIVDHGMFTRQLGDVVHQGIALRTNALPSLSLEAWMGAYHPLGSQSCTLLALDQVQDPQNVGALMRSALALGANALLLPRDGTPPFSGVLAKSAAGALDLLPLIQVANLSRALTQAQEQGFWCFGLDEKGKSINQAPRVLKKLLVVGTEGKGLRPLIKKRVDDLLCLPTNPNFPTLNVSVAGALALMALQNS